MTIQTKQTLTAEPKAQHYDLKAPEWHLNRELTWWNLMTGVCCTVLLKQKPAKAIRKLKRNPALTQIPAKTIRSIHNTNPFKE